MMDNRQKVSILNWLFLVYGIYGITTLLASADQLTWDYWFVNIVLALEVLVLWCLYRYRKNYRGYLACGVLLVGAFLLITTFWDEIPLQLHYMVEGVIGNVNGEAEDITKALLPLLMAMAAIFFIFEFLLRVHWIIYIFVTGLLLGAGLFAVVPDMVTLFMMALFQFAFWIMQIMERKKGVLSAWKMGNVAVIGLTVLFMISAVIVNWNPEGLYQAAYELEGIVYRNVERVTGISESYADGNINRGNVHPTGSKTMEVQVSELPSDTLYLREFSGGDYNDGKWENNTDQEIFQLMENNSLHWGEWSDSIPTMYQTMYYNLNRYIMRESEEAPRELYIRYNKPSINNWHVPYFGAWDRQFWRESESTGLEYRFAYYEQNEVKIDWDTVDEEYGDAGDWYYDLQKAYIEESQEIYTHVPTEEVPRLTQLCQENPKKDITDITAYIRGTLQEMATYTQTPGIIPLNEDPVEYFLFEHGQGYCQHYASTAVLMYRLYGIPARYTTGYAVDASDFEMQSDGVYEAVVTDQSAHAWPEIFIEDYGWIPVEVTYSSSPTADSEATDLENNQVQSEYFPGRENVEQEEGEETDQENLSEEDNSFHISRLRLEFDGKVIWWGAACMAVIVAFCIFIWNFRVRAVWMRKGGCRRIYNQLMHLVHFAGYLREYDGSETEFADRLSEVIKTIKYEDAQKLVSYANEEAFGKMASVNMVRVAYLEKVYQSIFLYSMEQSSFYKKIEYYLLNFLWR